MAFDIIYKYKDETYKMSYFCNDETQEITFILGQEVVFAQFEGENTIDSDTGLTTLDELFIEHHDPLLSEELVDMLPIFFTCLANDLCGGILEGAVSPPDHDIIVDLKRARIESVLSSERINTGSDWMDLDFIALLHEIGAYNLEVQSVLSFLDELITQLKGVKTIFETTYNEEDNISDTDKQIFTKACTLAKDIEYWADYAD